MSVTEKFIVPMLCGAVIAIFAIVISLAWDIDALSLRVSALEMSQEVSDE